MGHPADRVSHERRALGVSRFGACPPADEGNGSGFPSGADGLRRGNVFTTHTAVPAGFDLFSRDLVQKYFAEYAKELGIDVDRLMRLARHAADEQETRFNMAIFALRNTSTINAVSRLHAEVSQKLFSASFPDIPTDEVPILHVTNGVHLESWASSDMMGLLTRYLSEQWMLETSNAKVWEAVDRIPDTEFWRTHERRRERLVAHARKRLAQQLRARSALPEEIEEAAEVLDPRALTIGFARRFATYKRATLLFRDPERLEKILNDADRPVQIIFSGKAHPADEAAKSYIKDIVHFARRPGMRDKIVFLENYDLGVARDLVTGVDLWLNTPRRPLEASGTSGMKALVNGALNCSVLDGWWAEAYGPEYGWAVGAGEVYEKAEYQDDVESNALYDLLEKEIVPTFYKRTKDGLPRSWIAMMKTSMKHLCPMFNTDRMVQQYVETLYRPAKEYYEKLAADNFGASRAYTRYRLHTRENWNDVRIEERRGERKRHSLHGRGDRRESDRGARRRPPRRRSCGNLRWFTGRESRVSKRRRDKDESGGRSGWPSVSLRRALPVCRRGSARHRRSGDSVQRALRPFPHALPLIRWG
ncbi:MAG: alpha-glucan family phosphorylase [Deltaproteobacteria bacterium]|nr:alpha-glucan family phosphorylase [Deltaproteobacteria bacterium]